MTADKSLARALGLGSLLLIVANAVGIAAVFMSGYDWDLDHEFYYGSRLLAGELLWTREFHDKLPMLQMLTAIPAAFVDGIQVWRALSLGICLACMLGMRRWIPRLIDGDPRAKPVRQRAVDFGLLFLIAMTTMSPGNFSTINPVSSCLAAAVMVRMLLLAREETPAIGRRIAIYGIGGFAAALAISIRPYVLAPLAFTLLWLLAESALAKSPNRSPRQILSQCAAWGVAIGGFGLACNVLPYLVIGRLDALRDGLGLLAADVNKASFISNVVGFAWVSLRSADLLPIYMIVIVGSVLAFSIPGFRRGEPINRLVLHGLGAIVALLAYMAAKHWWNHYVHMFDAFVAYLLIVFVIQFGEGRMREAIGKPLSKAARYALPLLALLCLGFAGRDMVRAGQADTRTHPQAILTASIADYLANRPVSDRSFLAPISVYAHWQLRESRHGFPHAANTGHIKAGWWRGIGNFPSFLAPHNAREYCQVLMDKGPNVVVTYHGLGHEKLNRAVRACLTSPGSRYALDQTRVGIAKNGSIDFFVRREVDRRTFD